DTDEEENAIDPYIWQLSSPLALQSTQSATPSATPPASTLQPSAPELAMDLASAFTNDAAIPSPQCKHAAIHTIEDDGDLSENEMIKVYKIIQHDTTFAETILAIQQKGSHTHFIKSELYDD
ncbi:hypothetical protein BDQ12DRAFT_671440, partial [Crucibulum laeve]